MGDELPTGWQDEARCLGSEEFRDAAYTETKAEQNRAKRYCQECNVKHECLSYALLIREPHGVWGGHTAAERKKMNSLGSSLPGYQDGLRHQLLAPETLPDFKVELNWSF